MTGLIQLDDESLLSSLHAVVRTNRQATSRIVAHLAEVDARRLYAIRGHSSLFVYCVKELYFSEDEACRRIDAARLARRFPVILEMLEAGTASLSVLGLLKHSIARENAHELLADLARKSVRDAKEWLAARFPQPDLPESVRKLPSNGSAFESNAGVQVALPPEAMSPAISEEQPLAMTSQTRLPQVREVESPKPSRIEPLAADRFAVKLSISRAVRDKLELARDLASHRLPSGSLEDLFELALDALLQKVEGAKLGKATRPRQGAGSGEGAARSAGSKRAAAPRQSRREVVNRDGLRCSYVSPGGKRCDCRAFLEFDHITPSALGGGPESENLRLLCRTHNRLAAELAFGRPFMDRVVRENQERRADRSRRTPRAPAT